jgi:hypothetical protein
MDLNGYIGKLHLFFESFPAVQLDLGNIDFEQRYG